MRTYIIRRLLLIIPTLFIVSILVFLSVRLIPGSIVDMMIGEFAYLSKDEALDRAAIESRLGLDKPIYEQYGKWVGDIILHGSLGNSLRGDFSVTERILNRIPVTFELGILGVVIGISIAIPIGIYSAIRQDTIGDYIARSAAIIFISVPSFWVATIIMIYPSVWWGWSPQMQFIPFFENPAGNLGMFIIPSVILGMLMSGTTMRMTRTMMLEVLRQDYIKTAWAKGLRERVVVMRHGMKNALIPVVTIIGMQLPVLIGGSVIMEQIFNLPGIGRLMLESLLGRDYTVVSGVNLVIATVVLLINLFVDMTYAFLDPRIQYR